MTEREKLERAAALHARACHEGCTIDSQGYEQNRGHVVAFSPNCAAGRAYARRLVPQTSQPGAGPEGAPPLAGLHPEESPGARGTSGVRR